MSLISVPGIRGEKAFLEYVTGKRGGAVPTFRFEVKTVGADTFQLPIYNGGSYDFIAKWGDGNSDTITAWDDAAANHSYSGAGTYDVEITGTITGWRFANAGDKTLIYDISEWGPLNLGNNNSYFYGCSNLTISATDILDLTNTTTFELIFASCTSLTTIPSINSWDVSNITSLSNAFFQVPFNDDLSGWTTTSMTNIGNAFHTTANFNQDISGWDTSSVTTMEGTFVSSTTFDQDIGSWDISSMTVASNMFNGVTLSTANYDALLIGWEGGAHQDNVTFSGGNSKYSAGAAATARAALDPGDGWTITDGGQE